MLKGHKTKPLHSNFCDKLWRGENQDFAENESTQDSGLSDNHAKHKHLIDGYNKSRH